MMKLKGKEYKLKKFNLKSFKMLMAAEQKFKRMQQDEEITFDDIQLLEDLIVLSYGNAFGDEDLEEEFDIADLFKEFYEIIALVQEEQTKKVEEVANTINSRFGNVAK